VPVGQELAPPLSEQQKVEFAELGHRVVLSAQLGQNVPDAQPKQPVAAHAEPGRRRYRIGAIVKAEPTTVIRTRKPRRDTLRESVEAAC
jgi:hypothetical protein